MQARQKVVFFFMMKWVETLGYCFWGNTKNARLIQWFTITCRYTENVYCFPFLSSGSSDLDPGSPVHKGFLF